MDVFARLDANGDGVIDEAEFHVLGMSSNRGRKLWKKLDNDGDGVVTMDEFRY